MAHCVPTERALNVLHSMQMYRKTEWRWFIANRCDDVCLFVPLMMGTLNRYDAENIEPTHGPGDWYAAHAVLHDVYGLSVDHIHIKWKAWGWGRDVAWFGFLESYSQLLCLQLYGPQLGVDMKKMSEWWLLAPILLIESELKTIKSLLRIKNFAFCSLLAKNNASNGEAVLVSGTHCNCC